MTNAPERIWAFHAGPMVGLFVGKAEYGTNVAEYIRKDVSEAQTKAAVEAEREAIAKWFDKRRDDYISEHGSYDYSTGVMEFPGNGDEWVCEQEEIAEAIRARSKP